MAKCRPTSHLELSSSLVGGAPWMRDGTNALALLPFSAAHRFFSVES